MFVLRPSSPLRTPPPQPAAEVEEVEHVEPAAPAEPFIDRGLPIPEDYGVDIIRALLQDPFRVFIYWEVRPESLGALTRLFSPEEARAFRVVLKLRDLDGGQEAFFNVAERGRYWMMVFPGRGYEFEIGVRSPGHGFISLVRSNSVRTPRGTVSPESADAGEYKMSPPEFLEVLQASGFGAEQALDVTVAALPGTAEVAPDWASTILKLPDPVREAVMLASTGAELSAEIIAGLPDPLRSELMKLLELSGGGVAAVGLMHYLPELLREAIEDEREWIGDHIHPLHITQRFFLGGTESIIWPGGVIRLPGAPRLPSSDARRAGESQKGPGVSSHTNLRPRTSDL